MLTSKIDSGRKTKSPKNEVADKTIFTVSTLHLFICLFIFTTLLWIGVGVPGWRPGDQGREPTCAALWRRGTWRPPRARPEPRRPRPRDRERDLESDGANQASRAGRGSDEERAGGAERMGTERAGAERARGRRSEHFIHKKQATSVKCGDSLGTVPGEPIDMNMLSGWICGVPPKVHQSQMSTSKIDSGRKTTFPGLSTHVCCPSNRHFFVGNAV